MLLVHDFYNIVLVLLESDAFARDALENDGEHFKRLRTLLFNLSYILVRQAVFVVELLEQNYGLADLMVQTEQVLGRVFRLQAEEYLFLNVHADEVQKQAIVSVDRQLAFLPRC